MKDPKPVKEAPPKLWTQIVKLAKRLAFVESNLFARVFRLDEHMDRVRAFLTRHDIDPDAKETAQNIVNDVEGDEPSPG